MKIETGTIYRAYDGKCFADKDQCEVYEKTFLVDKLCDARRMADFFGEDWKWLDDIDNRFDGSLIACVHIRNEEMAELLSTAIAEHSSGKCGWVTFENARSRCEVGSCVILSVAHDLGYICGCQSIQEFVRDLKDTLNEEQDEYRRQEK